MTDCTQFHTHAQAGGPCDCQPALALHDLHFSYQSTHVLQGLDLNLKQGHFCTLVGSNGAGKSSLVRLILGELKPSKGSIRIFDQDICRFNDWPRIGYMAQTTSVDYDRFPATVLELVVANLYTRIPRFLPARACHRAQALEALEACGMGDYAQCMLGELSGGQRQRVLLARALVNKPDLLILDEPTNALDAASSERLVGHLEEIHAHTNTSMLMITHDLCCIPHSCDQVLELEHGKICSFSEVATLKSSECRGH